MAASADETFRQALTAYQSENLGNAELSLKALLRDHPGHGAALNLLSVVLTRTGQLVEAESVMQQAVKQGAASDATFYNYGVVLLALKRPADALVQFEQALALNPGAADIWNSRGVAYNDIGRYREAIDDFNHAISLRSDHVAAFCNKGKSLAQLQRHGEALAAFDRALAIEPALAEAWIGRGNVLGQDRRHDEALVSYQRAAELNPKIADAWRGCGDALVALDRSEEAIAAYNKAVAVNPRLARAWLGRANACRERGLFDEALASYGRAAEANPASALPWHGGGEVLFARREYQAAAAAFERAVALQPNFVEAWFNLGQTKIGSWPKDYDGAFVAYDRALAIEPEFSFVAGHRIHTKMYRCDWSNLDADIANLMAGIRASKKVSVPFMLLAVTDNPADRLSCAQSNIAAIPASAALWSGKPYVHDRIRVGYLSADFTDAPAAQMIAGILERHDKTHFETIGISTGPTASSPTRERIRASLSQFIDAAAWPDRQIAEAIRGLEIDIAVDLSGFSGGSHQNVLAMRPAPLQINYLGYPATMGADFIDYIIGDRTVIPAVDQKYYTEKVIYMPDSFQANDRTLAIADKNFTRAEVGLPDAGFVFCCFNQPYKITPAVFDSWMRILKEVANSVLWLYVEGSTAAENLRREAAARDVAVERLIFAPAVRLPEHMARLRVADLFLDTLPFNGGATNSTALWAGLPVLTRIGETYVGRMGASLLNAVGLPELVTTSAEAYEAKAVDLALNPEKITAIKRKLADNRLTAPLYDTERFTRNLESAYSTIVARQRRGEPPATVDVKSPAESGY